MMTTKVDMYEALKCPRTGRCAYCDAQTQSHTGLCLTHKTARNRGQARVKAEGLTLEAVGGTWGVWTARGDVLALGGTASEALIELYEENYRSWY